LHPTSNPLDRTNCCTYPSAHAQLRLWSFRPTALSGTHLKCLQVPSFSPIPPDLPPRSATNQLQSMADRGRARAVAAGKVEATKTLSSDPDKAPEEEEVEDTSSDVAHPEDGEEKTSEGLWVDVAQKGATEGALALPESNTEKKDAGLKDEKKEGSKNPEDVKAVEDAKAMDDLKALDDVKTPVAKAGGDACPSTDSPKKGEAGKDVAKEPAATPYQIVMDALTVLQGKQKGNQWAVADMEIALQMVARHAPFGSKDNKSLLWEQIIQDMHLDNFSVYKGPLARKTPKTHAVRQRIFGAISAYSKLPSLEQGDSGASLVPPAFQSVVRCLYQIYLLKRESEQLCKPPRFKMSSLAQKDTGDASEDAPARASGTASPATALPAPAAPPAAPATPVASTPLDPAATSLAASKEKLAELLEQTRPKASPELEPKSKRRRLDPIETQEAVLQSQQMLIQHIERLLEQQQAREERRERELAKREEKREAILSDLMKQVCSTLNKVCPGTFPTS